MAQQIINIGTSPNDGTGDQLRTAFEKCNDNFTELYAGTGGGAVDSVNGQTGVVVLDATDVDALQRDGSNANSDIDIDTFSFNAKSLHAKGTAGAGHLGLKHQSSNATASASETSLFAGSDGELYYKNDGNAVEQLASQSFVNSGLATKENTITAGTTSQYYRGDKTFQTLNIAAVSGLQTALDDKITQNAIQDISLTSTIVGWSSFTSRYIGVLDLGNAFLCIIDLRGISNNSTTSITVPFTNTGGITQQQIRVANSGIFQSLPGLAFLANGESTISFSLNNQGALFTNSGSKSIVGQILIYK